MANPNHNSSYFSDQLFSKFFIRNPMASKQSKASSSKKADETMSSPATVNPAQSSTSHLNLNNLITASSEPSKKKTLTNPKLQTRNPSISEVRRQDVFEVFGSIMQSIEERGGIDEAGEVNQLLREAEADAKLSRGLVPVTRDSEGADSDDGSAKK